MKQVGMTEEAKLDIRQARQWYEQQRPRLGRQFMREVRKTYEAIRERPQSFPKVYRTARRAQLATFKYGAFFFELDGERCVIFAVVHLSRHPRTWRRRL